MRSPSSSPEWSRLFEIRERGFIRVAVRCGTSAEQYRDPDTGQVEGMVGQLGRLLAKDLGVRAEFVNLSWADHIPALLDDRVDILLKHTNLPERALLVEFSSGKVLGYEVKAVIRRDRRLRGEESLNRPDRIIAAGAGDSQIPIIEERLPNPQLKVLMNTEEGLRQVALGEADACLADASIPAFLRRNPECTVLTDESGADVVFSRDCSHPCIKPGDQRFLNWLNNWMDFHEAQGTLGRLHRQAERMHEEKLDRILADFQANPT